MFYVIDKNTGEEVSANGFWAVGESGQLYDIIDGWGCEGGGGSSNAPSNFIAVFGEPPKASVAKTEPVKVPCGVCGKTFGSDDAMQQHRNMKHFAGVQAARIAPAEHYCAECGSFGCNGECFGDDMMGSSS